MTSVLGVTEAVFEQLFTKLGASRKITRSVASWHPSVGSTVISACSLNLLILLCFFPLFLTVYSYAELHRLANSLGRFNARCYSEAAVFCSDNRANGYQEKENWVCSFSDFLGE